MLKIRFRKEKEKRKQLFSAMLQAGLGDLDNSGVVAVIEALAGVKLAEAGPGGKAKA